MGDLTISLRGTSHHGQTYLPEIIGGIVPYGMTGAGALGALRSSASFHLSSSTHHAGDCAP